MEQLGFIEMTSTKLPVYYAGDKEACKNLLSFYEEDIKKETFNFEPKKILVVVLRMAAFIEVKGEQGETKTIAEQRLFINWP